MKMYWVHYFVSGLWYEKFRLWIKTHEYDHEKVIGQIQRDINGKTDLIKVSCHLHRFNCYFLQ